MLRKRGSYGNIFKYLSGLDTAFLLLELPMKISDIKENSIAPFEIDDAKLISLFGFFLHKAPTIESNLATTIDSDRLLKNWGKFETQFGDKRIAVYAASCSLDKLIQHLTDYGLNDEARVSRKTKAVVCKRKRYKI